MTTTATEKTLVGKGNSLAELVIDYHQRAHTSEYISTCNEEMCIVAQQVADFDCLLGLGA